MIHLLTAIGLSRGGSSTLHIYTQTIHRTTQNKQYIEQHSSLGKCRLCPILASYILAFALQLRKKHGKTSVRHHVDWYVDTDFWRSIYPLQGYLFILEELAGSIFEVVLLKMEAASFFETLVSV